MMPERHARRVGARAATRPRPRAVGVVPATRPSRTSSAWWSRSTHGGVDHPAEPERLAHDQVRPAVVDVDLGRLRVARDVDRLAGAHEVPGDPVEVEELAGKRADEVDGLVAVAVSPTATPDRHGAGIRRGAGGWRGRLAAQVPERALEQSNEARPAGIDHAGVAQDGQQARRLGERLLGGVRGAGEDRVDVVLALRGRDRRRRRLADHRQHRALDRPRDRAVRGRAGRRRGRGRGRGR